MTSSSEIWMREALRWAERAREEGEVPVGAILLQDDRVVGTGHNRREALQDPTAHAEMLAITSAAAALESWRLERCTLVVTLEPCAMCAGAIVLARIPRLIFGAFDPKAGACGSVLDVVREARLNHRLEPEGGVLSAECGALLSAFFAEKRRSSKIAKARIDLGPEAV